MLSTIATYPTYLSVRYALSRLGLVSASWYTTYMANPPPTSDTQEVNINAQNQQPQRHHWPLRDPRDRHPAPPHHRHRDRQAEAEEVINNASLINRGWRSRIFSSGCPHDRFPSAFKLTGQLSKTPLFGGRTGPKLATKFPIKPAPGITPHPHDKSRWLPSRTTQRWPKVPCHPHDDPRAPKPSSLTPLRRQQAASEGVRPPLTTALPNRVKSRTPYLAFTHDPRAARRAGSGRRK